MKIIKNDLADLKKARKLLEKDSFAIRLANLFGDAAEDTVRLFPKIWRTRIEQSCIVALEKSWEFSMTTMSDSNHPPESERRHRFYAILSGAIGGAGIISLFAEVPVTTLIIMRSVADVAKSEGEDFRQFDTKLACLQSFALSGDVTDVPAGEKSGYYASRTLLEKPLDESARYIAKKGFAGIGAPFSAQLLAKFAVRFQTFMTAKAAANVVPAAGAIMGLTVNIIFINYFQDKARGHFIIRRLEKKYGAETVRQKYKDVETGVMAKPEFSSAKTDRLIRHHVYASMGVGLIPIPFVDFAGVAGIQFNLLRKLAQSYNVPFSKNIVKTLIGALAGGSFPATLGTQLGGSLAKMIPGIGQTFGVAAVTASAGASTYAVGKVFNRHFAHGGTLLSFDPEATKAFYEEMLKEGREIVAGCRRNREM
ncbi:EcsC family protein [Desulfococcaceae bacterium HSG9]|nr:EcsC family protein [Desulfococcaceae bacterium HSG9]